MICNDSQVGIVCLNFGCGRFNSPSVWTRVDKYVNWINSTVYSKETRVSESKLLTYLQLVLYLVVGVV